MISLILSRSWTLGNWLMDRNIRDMVLGSSTGLMVKVLSACSLFFMNIAVTRSMGAYESGLFFLAFTIVTILATGGRIGLDQVVVRFTAARFTEKRTSEIYSILKQSLIYAGVASISVAIVLYAVVSTEFAASTFSSNITSVLNIAVISIPVIALYTLVGLSLQGLKRVGWAMLSLNVIVPCSMLSMFYFKPVSNAYDASIYLIYACGLALAFAVLVWINVAPSKDNSGKFSRHVLVTACLPLWGVSLLAQISQWSPQLILGWMGNTEDVAYFAVAQRTAMLTSFVLFAVNAIAAPKFSSLYANADIEGLRRIAKWSVRVMVCISLPMVMLLMSLPEFFMGIFGPQFTNGCIALMILAAGQFINIATGSVGYLLSMTGKEKLVLYNSLASTLVAVSCSFVLIPIYGLNGAAAATAVAVIIQNLMGVYQVNKHLGFNTLLFWK